MEISDVIKLYSFVRIRKCVKLLLLMLYNFLYILGLERFFKVFMNDLRKCKNEEGK